MTGNLASIDSAIVLVYLLATTALGAWFSRKQKDLNTYFVGDRDVSWWLVLISIVATETSTVTFLSVPGLAYDPKGGNLSFLQLSFGYLIGRVIIALLLLPQYMQGELLSVYQILRERFNPTVQRTASGIFLFTRAIADGLRLMLTALLLKEFAKLNMETSILVLGIFTILYTYLGGMQAVIWTDVIQFALYIAGALIAAGFILSQLPGGWTEFITAGHEAGRFVVIPDFDLHIDKALSFWTGLIGGAFVTMASHGADQMMVQRYLCSRSLRQAQLALVLSGVVVLVQFLLFLSIGVGLFLLKTRYQADISDVHDEAFGSFIVRYLPTGIVGLVIAAVLASSMSTLSSSLNSSASASVADFCKPYFFPNRNETFYLGLAKFLTAAWGVTRMAVAWIAAYSLSVLAEDKESQTSVVMQVLTVAGFTTGMVLGLFFLGRMQRPVSSRAALVGVLIGFLTVLSVWLSSFTPWKELPRVAWPWYPPIGALTTVAVSLFVNWLDRPAEKLA